VTFIMLLVFGLPIGFHHLYLDPFQAAGWKLFHGIGTFMVAVPTLITGFTVIAGMEIAGRLRGGKGLLGWIGKLPWNEPMVLAGGLSLVLLMGGGFGGMINASYSMNTVVHNTMWVPGHFHLIFGGTVIIMYMAIAYHLWPKMTGKQLPSKGATNLQIWLWFVGMLVLTIPWHWIGLMGQPRRTAWIPYDAAVVEQWTAANVIMGIGGVILTVSALLFIWNLIRNHLTRTREADLELRYAEAVHPPHKLPQPLNGFALWNWILVFWMAAAFGYPIAQFFFMEGHRVAAWGW
jgi:cytochrome c oxidase subunit 1